MARLIITHQGTIIKEYKITDEKVTVGRKPSNDIVLDDPTVSGLHAVFLNMQHIYVEDMNSTNGIKLNGKSITKRQLNHSDIVNIGQHEFKFIDDDVQDFESTVVISPRARSDGDETVATDSANTTEPKSVGIKHVQASVIVSKGAKQGESILLNKPYTKLGSADDVAVIARRGENYYLMPMTGGKRGVSPKLNGKKIGAESMLLGNGDKIEVAATELQFSIDE